MEAKRNSLPPDAKRVFKGVIYEVWQWQQTMFDGSTATFERLKRPDSVQIIAAVGDSILIEHQEQPARAPFVSPPGGQIDEGEDPLHAAQRELHEETGYASDDWMLWKEQQPSGSMDWTEYTYIARNCKKVAEPHLDSGEKIELRLVDFEDFLMLSEEPSFRGRDLIELMLRARLDPAKKEELRRAIFG